MAEAQDSGSCVRKDMQVQFLSPAPEKVRRASAGLFQLNPSRRTGEIRLRRVKRTDLISSSAKCSISSEGFARRFHRGAPQGPRNELAEFWGKGQCLDFTYHTNLRLNMGCSAPLKIKFKSSPLSIFAPEKSTCECRVFLRTVTETRTTEHSQGKRNTEITVM